tara:strand:+ start:449 stop:850 length:402 start_codon:yes stop_codon:yes gene_type:complete
MEALNNINELLKKSKYKNNFTKVLNRHKTSLTKKEFESFIEESDEAVLTINNEFSNLKKEIKNKINNHKENSERNKFYLSKYEILLKEQIKDYEAHYKSHIEFLFHKLLDLVDKRKTSFKSKKFGNGLFVALK